MSFRGLEFKPWTMKFTAGLQQKANDFALEPPSLDIAVDVEFDEAGGLRTRYPFSTDLGTDIVGGGSVADVRRLVPNGAELLLFTKDTLYSWSERDAGWVEKGTHLAIAVSEKTILATTADQMDGDRAELDGTVVFTWTDAGDRAYVAAIDKETGNVLMPPTSITGTAAVRMRLTALSTKILLSFYDSMNGLYCYALDPADPAAALAGASTTLTNTNFGEYYDITRVPGADMAVFATRRNPTTSYTIGTVTGALVVATAAPARTCDGPIAVSCSPDGTQVQVARANGTNIQGDLITIATLADVYTAQAIGTVPFTPINNIAAAHRSTQDGGQYRCYVTWSYQDGFGGFFSSGTKSNWVDTGNTLGAQADFVDRLGIASRSFDHDGHVFTWLVFAEVSESTTNGGATPVTTYGALQNTYFLYRDDGLLCGKAAVGVAGASYNASVGYLPGVQLVDTNTYAWCGIESRRIVVGLASAYSDRGPREIVFEFDTNAARRCVRLGQTLYITGAEILQYDGRQLTEVGFHVYPWQIDITEFAGAVPAANHAYKMSWRWDNARGERERSTTATIGLIERAAPSLPRLQPQCQLNVTHKATPAVAAEVWRTLTDPLDDSPYYLVTSPDPTETSTLNPNYYYANDVSAMAFAGNDDEMSDATAATKETHYENGGVLENLSPPPATLIAANSTRIFLAGVSGDPDRVWYSKQRADGEVAAFHDALVAIIPAPGGAITGLSFLNERLVVFRETAIYALDGDGFDNGGNGFNFTARLVSRDVGAVSQESIAITDRGVVFKSKKGWYILTGAFQPEYIGAGIKDYDDEEPLAVQAVEAQHQVRILTSSRMLVLDTQGGQWFEWSIADGLDACLWGGAHLYLASTGPKQQATTYTGVDYGMDVELAWLTPAGLDGYVCVNQIQVHGEYRSAHRLQLRLARDHWKDGVDTYFQDKTWTVSPTTVGAREKVILGPKIRQVESLKLRITALGAASSVPDGEALKLTGLTFEFGFQRGANRSLPAAQKQ